MVQIYTDAKKFTHTVKHISLSTADPASKAQILASIKQIMEKMSAKNSADTG